MGTWVEEEDESTGLLALPGEDRPILGDFGREPTDEPESGFGLASEPSLSRSHVPALARPDMLRNDTFPFAPAVGEPLSPSLMSPMSPTKRRRVRYGTLLPELAPVGAPTGFSIGLGAASPGFVLRPGPFGSGGSPIEGRSRSRSEGAKGIQEIMNGPDGNPAVRGLAIRDVITGSANSVLRDDEAVTEEGAPQANQERSGSSLHAAEQRRSWWNRLLGSEGRIRLKTDDQYQT